MNGPRSLPRGEGPPSQGWGGSHYSALPPRGSETGLRVLSASAGSQGHLRVQSAPMSPVRGGTAVPQRAGAMGLEGVRGRLRARCPAQAEPLVRPRPGAALLVPGWRVPWGDLGC